VKIIKNKKRGEKMKKIFYSVFIVVVCAAIVAVFSLIGCKAETVESTAAVVEQTTSESTVAATTETETTEKAEPVKLNFWHFGEADAPGMGKWLAQVIPLYEERNPNITIEAKALSQDTLITDFKAAAAVKDPEIGPDIQYFWDGTYTLEDAWLGNLAPVSDYIAPDKLETMMTLTRIWDGKAWGVGFYNAGVPIFYNKEYFKKAGLDPDNPPKTWDEFMSACEALKTAGITPMGFGVKDQWGNGWLISEFGFSYLDSVKDMTNIVADGTLVNEKWLDFMTKINDMRKKGYFNEDASSLDFFQGWDLFPQGKVAMIMVTDGQLKTYEDVLGAGNVGIMNPPSMGNGKLAGRYPPQINGLGITSWSNHKQEAADFLVFLHSEEILKSFYDMTGVIPTDTKFDPSWITLPEQNKIYDGVLSGKPFAFWLECFFPVQLDTEGWYPSVQQLWVDELDPQGVLEYCQDVLVKWREQNPQQVDIYKNWEFPEGY
jgi:raffinose/stachyose/melibiose transport system substrate-binding protein